jgi:GNAT superfamily N-acetyltransferase
MSPSERYLASLLAAGETAHGRPLGSGTTLVVDPERDGTGSATCYPTPHASIVWCDPSVLVRLASIESSRTLSAQEFAAAAADLGAMLVGYGRNRVLDGDPRRPDADLGDLVVRHVGTGDAPPISMLDGLIAACDDDDVEEADLDLDHLDPTFTLLVTPDGTIAAYASGRPYDVEPSFDDIAVLTHPAWRGRRLGALAVHEFIRQRQAEGRRWLYRCNVDNVGSNRVAESLGFTLVTTIGAVRFRGDDPAEVVQPRDEPTPNAVNRPGFRDEHTERPHRTTRRRDQAERTSRRIWRQQYRRPERPEV